MKIPRSVYVHIPFCRHRCGYCNFTLVAKRDHLVDRYLDALEREINSVLETSDRIGVDTIFIGGGTPTHLSLEQTTRLLALINSRFALAGEGEFSVEANPRDMDASKTELLAKFGVNRLSVGAQSFHADKLRLLERDHDAVQVEKTNSLATTHFPSHSLDLIFSTPGETVAIWQADLDRAIRLNVPHVSTYGLTIEKGTQFWNRVARGTLSELDEEPAAEMYELAIDTLTSAGYEHYEVSNFAKPEHRSRHNEAYWTGKSYFGFGAGAAAFVEGKRTTNHRSTTTYIKRVLAGDSPVAESEQLAPEGAARERLVFALRRLEGISMRAFELETGFPVAQLAESQIDRFVDAELLEMDDDWLKLTRRGLLVSDSLWPEIL